MNAEEGWSGVAITGSEDRVDRSRAPVAFLNKTYEETLALLGEVRDYITFQERKDRQGLLPLDQLVLSRETSRLTTMLTQVMAWLLTQKAVFAGELSRQEAAAPEHQLGASEICFDSRGLSYEPLPQRFRDLFDQGYRLYVRVARLDELSRRQVS